MANITIMEATFATSRRDKAGTNGDVYIGIGGREFNVDSEIDDFEPPPAPPSPEEYYLYRFGEASTVKFAARNDPRDPQLLTEELDRYPVYVRFAPQNRDDHWHLGFVELTVNPGRPEEVKYEALRGNRKQWLGTSAGLYCHLTKV